jgi:hypothetical protein
MHYSDKPNSVKVSFWKRNGRKWNFDEAIIWPDEEYSDGLIHDQFAKALMANDTKRLIGHEGLIAYCYDPYHEHAHPICLDMGDIEFFEGVKG